MMVCSFQLSYTVNSVGKIVNDHHNRQQNFNFKIRIINNYMAFKRLGFKLQFKYFLFSKNSRVPQFCLPQRFLKRVFPGIRSDLVFK